MKPLVLEVFPLDDEGEYRHPRLDFAFLREDIEQYIELTRLTDTELAAEYHQQAAYTEYWMGRTTATHTATNQDRLETLRRFATLPHAGDEQ